MHNTKGEEKLQSLNSDTMEAGSLLYKIMQLPCFAIIFNEGEQQSIRHLREQALNRHGFLLRIEKNID